MRLSYGRQLAQQSEAAKEKDKERRQVRADVLARSGRKCELCPRSTADLEGHHVWRRASTAAIPSRYSESAESIIALCISDPRDGHVGCHNRYHLGDLPLIDRARRKALRLFAERWDLELPRLEHLSGGELVDEMRACVRRLEERT